MSASEARRALVILVRSHRCGPSTAWSWRCRESNCGDAKGLRLHAQAVLNGRADEIVELLIQSAEVTERIFRYRAATTQCLRSPAG